jgi:hypothetical protein
MGLCCAKTILIPASPWEKKNFAAYADDSFVRFFNPAQGGS